MWQISSSSDPLALAIVDGLGEFAEYGPHYSRRTPGSKTFTGVGREIVLLSEDKKAVWAVVYQRTPSAVGSGKSRGRAGSADNKPKYVWRNMLFRNLGGQLSSALILSALKFTYTIWAEKYGSLPIETLRTEIDPRKIKSKNPGYCYKKAGFHSGRMVRGKLYLDAPCPTRLITGDCACCKGPATQ